MARPMTGKQRTVHYLIMVGLYQLLCRIPPRVLWLKRLKALSQLASAARVDKRWPLRQFQRQQEELLAEFNASDARYLHPSWLLKRLPKSVSRAVAIHRRSQ